MSFRVMLVVSLLLCPVTAFSFQGFVQSFGDNGKIVWGNGEIYVTRILETPEQDSGDEFSPLSVRRAASQARKQLLDIIMSVRIDSKQTVSAFLSGDDELSASVRGLIHNSPFQRPSLFDEKGQIVVSESLRGKLAELVIPTTIQFQSGIPPRLSTSLENSMSFSANDPEEAGSGATGYTGLVVDARGLNVTPALAPVIYGQDGLGAYGSFLVSRANAIDNGVVAYATTIDTNDLLERAGSRPLVVKAINAYGSWRTDLIISSPMARLVRAIMRPGDIVNRCRVVIVVDAPEPSERIELGIGDDMPSNEVQ